MKKGGNILLHCRETDRWDGGTKVNSGDPA